MLRSAVVRDRHPCPDAAVPIDPAAIADQHPDAAVRGVCAELFVFGDQHLLLSVRKIVLILSRRRNRVKQIMTAETARILCIDHHAVQTRHGFVFILRRDGEFPTRRVFPIFPGGADEHMLRFPVSVHRNKNDDRLRTDKNRNVPLPVLFRILLRRIRRNGQFGDRDRQRTRDHLLPIIRCIKRRFSVSDPAVHVVIRRTDDGARFDSEPIALFEPQIQRGKRFADAGTLLIRINRVCSGQLSGFIGRKEREPLPRDHAVRQRADQADHAVFDDPVFIRKRIQRFPVLRF